MATAVLRRRLDAHRRAGRQQHGGHGAGQCIEALAQRRVGVVVGGNRQLAALEARGREMLAIAHRPPGEEILDAVRAAGSISSSMIASLKWLR